MDVGRERTVAPDIDLVRQLGDGHVEAVLHAVECLSVGLVRDERDRQSLGAESSCAGNLELKEGISQLQ